MRATHTQRRAQRLGSPEGFLAETPAETAPPVSIDNDCAHHRCHTGLAEHPKRFVHFTPASARWLSQGETWFGILSR